MSVTYRAAAQFCAWLTEKTGTTYRLPTDAEWSLAAQGGVGLDGVTGDLLDAVAWYRANSAGSTHPVAARRADGLGLFDLLGNVAEWVAGAEGPLVRGGSYRDLPPDVGPNARARQAPAWNARDPQIPKSPWWLSDGPFVGFRIVREP